MLKETEHLYLDYNYINDGLDHKYLLGDFASFAIHAKDSDRTVIAYVYWNPATETSYIQSEKTTIQDYVYTGEMYTQEFIKLVDEADYRLHMESLCTQIDKLCK